MGLKRKPQTNLLDLLKGGSKKGGPEESQPQPPAPPPQILTVQTRSSSAPTAMDPPTESHDPKRKRLSKGKEPMDESKSHSPPEEGRFRRPPKQLKLGDQQKGKKATQQSEAQAWLPAAMLHDQPLMDNASMRESQGNEGALVAEALEKSLLLPTDMAEIMSIPPGSSSSQFTYTNTAAATNAAAAAAASSYFPTPFHLQHSAAAAAVTAPSQYPAPYVGPTPPPVVYPAAPAAAPVYSLPQYHQPLWLSAVSKIHNFKQRRDSTSQICANPSLA
ncbi:actin cytoskeleton-regulatory complex protein pan1-like [Quercus suber]|uniref:actin cytoskeleton-regulatory complex protein pan1-like n=1 Tax=Quercus suber TaxID=58331 RepID=UPI0032DE9800